MAEVGTVYDAAPAPRTAADVLPATDDQRAHAGPGPVAANKWLTASVVENAAEVVGRGLRRGRAPRPRPQAHVRHLVKDRMDLTGARWGLHGAEAVLKLRALRSNDDFDDYWRYHLAQKHQRVHRSRYADNKIPHRA